MEETEKGSSHSTTRESCQPGRGSGRGYCVPTTAESDPDWSTTDTPSSARVYERSASPRGRRGRLPVATAYEASEIACTDGEQVPVAEFVVRSWRLSSEERREKH